MIELAHPPAIIRPAPPGLWMPKQEFVVPKKAIVPGMMPQVPPSTGVTPVFTLTYINQGNIATDGTSFNFGNFTFPNGGLAIVAAGARASGGVQEINSISIGGSPATVAVGGIGDFNNDLLVATQVVTAGAQNVTLTTAGSALRASVDVWLLENYLSATPTAGNIVHSSATLVIATGAFNIPANGAAIYFVLGGGGAMTAIAWSSATEVSDRMNEVRFGAAQMLNPTGSPVAGAQTVTISGTSAQTSIIYAAFN